MCCVAVTIRIGRMMRDWNSITYDRYLDDQKIHKNVGHGMLDISRDIPSDFIRKHSHDMTFWMINQCLKMGYGKYRGYSESVKEILTTSLDNGDHICIIQAQGMMSLRLAHIVGLSIKYFENNPDKFVIGHIMARENRYPGLHRQLLIVNLKTWDRLGRPEYLENGFFWDRKPCYQNYTVSENKITAEYTPEHIVSKDGVVYPSYTEDGANWIDLALRNNIQIDNLDIEMRECKCFLYPYEDTEQLEKVWNNLQDESEVDKLINYSTRAWMRKLAYQEMIEKDRVYAFNTERLSAEGVRATGPIDNLFCAAAGFKPLALLRNNQFNENTTVHYFDWCESSVNFKKHLLDSWDGSNFDKWLLEHDLKYNFSSTYRGNYSEFWELEITKEFESKEAFKQLWDRYKLLKHEFHVIDIVNEPEKLFEIINKSSGINVLWTTNIWASLQLHWNIEPEVLEEKYLKFESLIKDDLVLYGQDYMARDLQNRVKYKIATTHPRYSSRNKYINMGI
jgi:hypothetical protein